MFTANLTPTKKLNLSVFAGLGFSGKLKIKDSMGELVEESKYDPALLVGVTFEFRF